MSSDGFKLVESKKHTKKNHNKITNKINKLCDSNKKRILCQNMLLTGSCPYGHECVYAHSLSEQNVDPIRKTVYDLLISNTNLEQIDLVNNIELQRTLFQFTNYCSGCEKKTCLGGYNCKNGVVSKKYVICRDDLNFGSCCEPNCDKLHLTKRGLIPYKVQLLKLSECKIQNTTIIDPINTECSISKPITKYCDEQSESLTNYMIHNDDELDMDAFDGETSDTNSCDDIMLSVCVCNKS